MNILLVRLLFIVGGMLVGYQTFALRGSALLGLADRKSVV